MQKIRKIIVYLAIWRVIPIHIQYHPVSSKRKEKKRFLLDIIHQENREPLITKKKKGNAFKN